MNVIVVGSGIAGLATALRLACAGHRVQVFESNAYPGGKLSLITSKGYRFDAGPSLFTMPQLVLELYQLAGKPVEDFPYLKLDAACHYFYEDGTRFIAYHDKEKFKQEIAKHISSEDAKQMENYLKQAQFKYDTTAPLFVEQSLHRLRNFLNLKTLKGILAAPWLHLYNTMDAVNKKYFKHPHLVQYFNRFATYNGSSPYKAPGLLTMIPHLEHHIGTFFPKHGMHQITQSFHKLAVEKGVQFHFNTRVDEIVVEQNKVKGVRSKTNFYAADVVVSNADVHTTYTKLLPHEPQPKKLLSQEKSSSALIFYWGIKRSFPELDLHNIFFSADYETEFRHLFDDKTVHHDPTVYINITSKYKPDDAPAGCENWFVMINVPNNSGQNWDEIIPEARKNILAKLSRLLHTDIEPLIETEELLEPRTIESRTSSYAGALYGNASNNRYAAFLRHKNFSDKIKGLYFCGGSVHPGGGIPLCLNSAKITAQLVQERE
jgi:phytoene desaturase